MGRFENVERVERVPEWNNPDHAPFHLSDLYVDPASGILRGRGGETRLEPRVMSVLQALARSPGRVVLREQLLAGSWPGGDIYDEALTQCIYQLRQQLVSAGGSDAYRDLITTVPKRGYLLRDEVRTLEPESTQTPPAASTAASPPRGGMFGHARLLSRPLVLMGVAVTTLILTSGLLHFGSEEKLVATSEGLPGQAPVTIAVLPFTDLSAATESEYLVDGLSEELLGTLALHPELRVTSRSSSFQFKGQERDAGHVGRLLGVRYVLDGGVRSSGERVSVQLRLIDAKTGARLWEQAYDRSLADWFDLQQVVAGEVSRTLDVIIRRPDGAIARTRGTTSLEAHLEVLRARQLLATRAVADAEQAIEHLQRALLLDPNYALAYARLADAILIQAESTNGITAARPVVASLLDKALALDPGLGEAYCLRSLLTDDRTTAERDLRRGLELNPSFARGYELLAGWQALSPLPNREAFKTIDSAIALDPLSPRNYHAKAQLMMGLGNWEEAAELDRRALELNPNYRAALTQLSEVYSVQGYFADAIEYARRAVALDPRALPMRDHLTLLYLAVGDLAAARAANNPPTPFGNWAIPWTEGKERQLVDMIYDEKPTLVETMDPLVSSQLLLGQALSDGDYARALRSLSALLPFGDALPPEVGGWRLYAYANLAQLLLLNGDAAAASRLQEQLEERMATLEARLPRHALINSQVRATLLARQGHGEEACAALEQAYTPNPRPLWRVILANPAFDEMTAASCFQALRARIENYIATERERINARERADQRAGSAPPNPDHGAGAAN